MTEKHAEAMTDLRARVAAVVHSVDPTVLDRPAPATPGWRARDVLAHIVGVSDDVVNGRLEGIASDEWTGAQVERRRAVSVGEMLEEWQEHGPQFEAMLAGAPAEIAGQAVFDAATHEHDLRNAIERSGGRDSRAMHVSWDWFVETRSAPAIQLHTERGDEIAGIGEPKVSVRAPYFELLRAATGRRTAAEISGFDWEPGPDVMLLLAAPFFTVRHDSLGE